MHKIGMVLTALLAALGLMAETALADGPASRFTEDVTGRTFVCEDASYEIISGELRVVTHEGSSPSGNANFTVTFSMNDVVAADEEGTPHAVRGAGSFSGTFNSQTGGEQFTFTATVQIVQEDGGSADSVNLTLHVTAQPGNVVIKDFDFGTCAPPT